MIVRHDLRRKAEVKHGIAFKKRFIIGKMENTIIILTVISALFAGLFFIACICLYLQYRQIIQNENYIQTLEKQKDIFPEQNIHLVSQNTLEITGYPKENANNFRLDENYMRKGV